MALGCFFGSWFSFFTVSSGERGKGMGGEGGEGSASVIVCRVR
jgi:hypothetical protein